jgi:hypothetical protein
MSDAVLSPGVSRRAFLTQLAAAPLAAAQATAPRPPLIDTHVHVWTDDPASFPFAHPNNPNFRPPAIAATAEALLAEMDRHAISHAALVQVIDYGWDNRYLAYGVKEHRRRHSPTNSSLTRGITGEPGLRTFESAVRLHAAFAVTKPRVALQGISLSE